MTTTDTPATDSTHQAATVPADPSASEPTGGGGGQPSESTLDRISESAHGIFGQRDLAEAALAKAWGVPREDLRAYRLAHLVEGSDWAMESRQVIYTADGEKKAAERFGVTLGGGDTAPEPSAAPTALPEATATLFCVRRLVVNPKLLLFGEKTADGEKIGPDLRLRVADSSRFIPGMDLTGRVRLIAGYTDFYELTCPRPRYRGRW